MTAATRSGYHRRTPNYAPDGSPSAVAAERHLQHLRNRGLAPVYIDCRRRALLHLEWWCDKPLLDITAEDLDRWQVGALVTRTTARSRNNAVTHVKEFFRWSKDVAELVDDERGRLLARSRTPRLVPRPITEPALAVALAQAPARIKPMLYLAAYQGLRAVEIARLRREDLDDDQDQPTITVSGKGNKERVLPLSPRVWQVLQDSGLPKRGPLFFMYDEDRLPSQRPITAHRVCAACNRYLDEIGAGASLHQLRHFFATSLYRASKDLRLTQEALGHASPATTAIYAGFDAGPTAGYLQEIAARVDARVGALR